jgi:hypothetical protein
MRNLALAATAPIALAVIARRRRTVAAIPVAPDPTPQALSRLPAAERSEPRTVR